MSAVLIGAQVRLRGTLAAAALAGLIAGIALVAGAAPSRASAPAIVTSECVDLVLHLFAHVPMPGNAAENYDATYVAQIRSAKARMTNPPAHLDLRAALAPAAPRFAASMQLQALTVIPVVFASVDGPHQGGQVYSIRGFGGLLGVVRHASRPCRGSRGHDVSCRP
ncbi:MAG: hypothetical protein NUW23_04200 [Firmicutes bacterium]|nr:hypothetical protein [Bacillota bacterium]